MWHKNPRYLGIKEHCKPEVHIVVFICERYSLLVFQSFVFAHTRSFSNDSL